MKKKILLITNLLINSKNNKMKNSILLVILSFLIFSCSKTENTTPETPPDQLPAITTTGANTAGCVINGKVIIPKNTVNSTSGFISYGLRTGAGINFHPPIIGDDYKFFDIANLKDKGISYSIYIHLNDMTMGTGLYTVGQSNNQYFIDGPNNPQIIVRETFDNVSGKTFISGANSGTINITKFEYTNGIYSGTFNCTLYNKDVPTEIIQVTDGRFDISVATLNQ
jgi:hypothetical protein